LKGGIESASGSLIHRFLPMKPRWRLPLRQAREYHVLEQPAWVSDQAFTLAQAPAGQVVLEDVTVEQLGLGTRLAECLEQTAAQFLPAVSGIDHPVKEIRHRPPGPAEPDLFARHGSGCGHHALALDHEDLRIGVEAAALPVIGALM